MQIFNLMMHTVWAAFLLWMLNRNGWPDTQSDSVSVGLTILEITLIAGGVFAFLEIRSRAEKTAKAAAEKICPDLVDGIVLSYMNDNLPTQVREHVEIIMPSLVENADQYGKEAEDENESGNS